MLPEGVQNTFVLPSELTMENIVVVHEELKRLAAGENKDIVLDASSLQKVTTAGLQLLVSLDKSVSQQNGHLRITASSVLQETCELCGLGDYWAQWNGGNNQ